MLIPEILTEEVCFPGAPVPRGEAPTLEGILHLPPGKTNCPGVVLCHANPKAGGNMDMKLMLALEVALARRGFATLRYNSRGIGGSTGAISGRDNGKLVAPEGEPETADVGAALAFLAGRERVDGQRLALVGHSFGARISLSYLAKFPDDKRIDAVVCIGLAVAWGDLSHLGDWRGPKLFVTGDRDDFCPPAQLEKFVEGLPHPAAQAVLKGTGHFFEGREGDLGAVVAQFLSTVMAP